MVDLPPVKTINVSEMYVNMPYMDGMGTHIIAVSNYIYKI